MSVFILVTVIAKNGADKSVTDIANKDSPDAVSILHQENFSC